MKGIVLAGGTGARLWPITTVVSKQLLPVHDKPMIYYPLATLMLAGVKEILIITTPQDSSAFRELLGDGQNFGINLEYATQKRPEGIAQALIIGEEFLGDSSCLLILGDNIFHGVGLGNQLASNFPENGAHIFTYVVSDPSAYGVLNLEQDGSPASIVEKPVEPQSNLAITGLYYFDNKAVNFAKSVKPSARGELEITSVLNSYLDRNMLTHTHLKRGTAWLDTGKPSSLQDASSYVRVVEERTGLKIACLEEIGLNNGWIDKNFVAKNLINSPNNEYFNYVRKIL
jgi:glucose-1-phosphate thymidylyltransferase